MDRNERRLRTEKVVASRILFVKRRESKPTTYVRREDGTFAVFRSDFHNLPSKRVGRFRKHKPWDCGKPRCGTCHSEPRNASRDRLVSDAVRHDVVNDLAEV